MLDEFIECETVVKASLDFQEAIKKRGITDTNLGIVDPWSAGNYDIAEEMGSVLGLKVQQRLVMKLKSRYAVVLSTILSGLFFIVLSYTEVLGFSSSTTPLNQSAAPLNDLANLAGVGFFGLFITVAAIISFFGCALASINAGARIFFTMARHGIFHASMGKAHNRNGTPHIAVTMSSLFVFLVPASMSLFGLKILDIYGYLGTIATYGFLLAYILISIAAPVYLYRMQALNIFDIAIAAIAIIFMLIPVVGSVYPVPAVLFNVFTYLFLMYLVVGTG